MSYEHKLCTFLICSYCEHDSMLLNMKVLFVLVDILHTQGLTLFIMIDSLLMEVKIITAVIVAVLFHIFIREHLSCVSGDFTMIRERILSYDSRYYYRAIK